MSEKLKEITQLSMNEKLDAILEALDGVKPKLISIMEKLNNHINPL